MSDPKDKRPRPLSEDGLRHVIGGVGPLSPEDLASQGGRIVIDLGRAPPPAKPRRKPAR